MKYLSYVFGGVSAAAAAGYLIVYLYRWEWQRAILSGVLLLVIEGFLIGLVLLHSGKGGGLSDMFGGGAATTALGSAAAERNLDRITVVVALVMTVGIGLMGTWRILGQKAAPVLRQAGE